MKRISDFKKHVTFNVLVKHLQIYVDVMTKTAMLLIHKTLFKPHL